MEDYQYYWDEIGFFDVFKYMIFDDKKDGDNWIYCEKNKDVSKYRNDFLFVLKIIIKKYCDDELICFGYYILNVEFWNVDVWIDSDFFLLKVQLSKCFDKLMNDIEYLLQFYFVFNIWYKRECNIGYKFYDENWSIRI